MRFGWVLLTVALAACGVGEPAVSRAPRVAEPAVAERVERDRVQPEAAEPPLATLGGWTPPAVALALARALADPATAQAARARFHALGDDQKADVVRAGLRLPDERAVAVARLAKWTWLDHVESGRLVDLLLPHLFDEDEKVDFEEFRSLLGSVEMTRVLALFAERQPGPDLAWMLVPFHRQVREEHVPALAGLVGSREPALADAAWEVLAIVLEYTDAHRAEVAAAVRARLGAGRAPGGTTLPHDLLSMLDVLLAKEQIGDRFANGYLFYALRWLIEEDAGPGDRPFLIELRQRAEAMGDEFAGERVAAVLARVLGDVRPDAEVPWLTWVDDDGASAYELRDILLDTPLDELGLMLEDMEQFRHMERLSWGPTLYAHVLEGVDIAKIAPHRLAALGALLPEWRTRAVAERALLGVTASGGLRELAHDIGDRSGRLALAFLEAADRDRLVATLRAAAQSQTPAVRRDAALLLVHLRATGGGAGLESLLDEWNGSREAFSPFLAAGTRDPVVIERVERWLRGPDRAGVFTMVGLLGGLPDELAAYLANLATGEGDEGAPSLEIAERLADQLRARDVAGALVTFLGFSERDERFELGTVRVPEAHDAVVAHLRAMQTRRGTNDYVWATAQLAHLGESDAIAEMRAVAHEGRYRWVDNASPWVMTDGGNLDELAFWTTECASNCCRFVAANGVFEELLGFEPREMTGSGGIATPPRAWLDEWWARIGGKLVWSEAAAHYVPAVR